MLEARSYQLPRSKASNISVKTDLQTLENYENVEGSICSLADCNNEKQ